MTRRENNPHAWLFAYLRNHEGFESAEAIRAALVFEWSEGATDSLKELYERYPERYRNMRNALTERMRAESSYKLDKARKRLIAVIFDYLNQQGVNEDIEYVKGVACRAAKRESFNDIPLQTLKALYRQFGEKAKTI